MSGNVELPSPSTVSEPDGHFSEVHGPEALTAMPGAEAAIGGTIANFAAADANLRIMLLSLFGDDIPSTSKLIDELRRDDQVGLALKVVVSLSKRTDMDGAVRSYLSARNKVKKFRDNFAHGVWARRSDLKDRVILFPANPYRKAHSEMFTDLTDGGYPQFNPKQAEAWSETDFSLARKASTGLLFGSQALSVCFRRGAEEVAWLRDTLEERGLLSDPPHVLSIARNN
ncbi:hypothetical protein [Sulfitobacter sp. CS16]|uniref:hypothetical protein n=1 Tax=Sulfitobacter sp. CS16 TaxID=3368573 RepID=UPI0037461FB2